MKNSTIPYLLFLYLLLAGPVFSQQYNIKIYGPKNGLASSVVNHILVDKKGYIWFATQGGLSRFDGKNFQNFSSKNGLPGNDITFLAEDKEGNLWIAAYGSGLARYDGVSFTNYGEKEGLTNTNIYNVICDSKNIIWITTRGGGIFSFENGKFANYSIKDGLPTDQFLAAVEDKQGMLWFGTKGFGLISYDRKAFRVFNEKDGLNHPTVISLSIDKKGVMWIGSAGSMPNYYSNGEFKTTNIPEIKTDLISMITEDDRGNTWIASEHGLVKYQDGKYKIYAEANGLPANSVYAVCTDYEGNIWMGTSNGIGLFKNEAFIAFTDKQGLSNPKVTAIFQNKAGETFIGTSGGGLNVMRNDSIERLDYITEIKESNILAIYETPTGEIWIGIESGNIPLIVLRRAGRRYEVVKRITDARDSKINTIAAIISDGGEGVWVATYGNGVIHYSGNTIEYLDMTNGMPVNEVFTILLDSKKRLWMGTYLGGAAMYDNGKLKVFNQDNGLPDNIVYTLCEDLKGNVFLGTANKGIAVYRENGFLNLSTTDGLCSDVVSSLVADSKNRIWVGTDKGVNRLSLDEKFSVMGVKYYSENDGLKSIEINQNTFMIDNQKKFWFGTTYGMIRYNPEYDYVNDKAPLVRLSGIKLFFEDVNWDKLNITFDKRLQFPDNPELSYDDNHFTFNFQALTTDNVQYTFILDGLDKEWSPLTNKTEAVYTNIPPGTYIFKVKAKNSDEFWSEGETTFSFVILPPFYMTWWFFTLLGIAAVTGVVTFIRWRTRRLEAEKRILEHRVEVRTKELKKANDQLSVAFKDIKDSINYAKRIQEAILPLENEIRNALPEHFILFKPRDVVSGDFYWFTKKGQRTYIAACDCTGHGVPGAFMSIIGTSLLNEIIHEFEDIEPGKMLNLVRERLINSLKQSGAESESKDGMDMALCCIDEKRGTLSFAGANNPLYLFSDGKINEHKGDKQPIGVYGSELKSFRNHEFPYTKGDVFYIFTDGYPDQFGGPKGKKFLYTRFKDLLTSFHKLSMPDQILKLESEFSGWRGDEYEQVDDVLVIGVRL